MLTFCLKNLHFLNKIKFDTRITDKKIMKVIFLLKKERISPPLKNDYLFFENNHVIKLFFCPFIFFKKAQRKKKTNGDVLFLFISKK
jgi:hypothetical protein